MAMGFGNDMTGAPVRRAMQRQQPMTGTPPMQSQQAFTGTPTGLGGQFGQAAAQIAQNPQAFAQQYGSPIAQTGYQDPQQQYQVTGGNISAPMTPNSQLAMQNLSALQQQIAAQQQRNTTNVAGSSGAMNPAGLLHLSQAGGSNGGMQSQQAFTGTPTGGGGAFGGLAAPSTQTAAPQRMAAMLRAVRPSRY